MLAIMSIMWSVIEYSIIKGMIDAKEMGKDKIAGVRKAIRRRKKRNRVPLKVRIYFIKHKLNVIFNYNL
jgi:hypothetical protein